MAVLLIHPCKVTQIILMSTVLYTHYNNIIIVIIIYYVGIFYFLGLELNFINNTPLVSESHLMANFRANREGVMMNCSIPEIQLHLKDCELMENFGVIELTSKINICVISLNYFIMQHGCNPMYI